MSGRTRPDGWVDWVHEVMCAWGRWAVAVEDGGRGYAREVAWARLGASSHVFESKLPSEIIGSDILQADSAVKTLPIGQRAIVATYYKRGAVARIAAAELGFTTRFVSEHVAASHPVIAREMRRGA